MSTIFITGANRGLGLEFVRQYAAKNDHVIACCRNPLHAQALQELAQKHKNISVCKLDVTSEIDLSYLKDSLGDEPIDVLINNAGVLDTRDQGFIDIDDQTWLDVFRTNTIAPYEVSQMFINNVKASAQKIIVNMGSSMGSITENTSGSYYAYRSSKAALNAVTKSMSIDLRDFGITVVSLHPGWVKTDMGGEGSNITPEVSVAGSIQVISQLTLAKSGKFLRYTGEELPW